MSRLLRAPLCAALALSAAALAGPAASAEPAADPAPAPKDVARGIVVRTTVTAPTLERATEQAADGVVGVDGTAAVADDVSTVLFDETLSVADAAEVAAEVARRPDVEWAVPDARRQASATAPVTTDDVHFPNQFSLWDRRTASQVGATTFPVGGYAVKAPALWRSTRGTAGTVVAVLDTGVVLDHPDLADQLVPGHDMVDADTDPAYPSPFYTAADGDGRDADPSDPGDFVPEGDETCYGTPTSRVVPSSWHGTHVAGIVAAEADNGIGVAGVAPGVTVRPVRVLGRCGGYDSDILAGITWASGGAVEGVPSTPPPADVINLSLGGYARSLADRDESCVAYADVLGAARERGSLVVVAAGNDLGNADRAVPASCDGALSVGSTSERGFRAWYANRGASIDLSAAGGDDRIGRYGVISTLDSGQTTPEGPTYGRYSGTSMAAPAVAGGAALLRSLGVTGPARLEAALRTAVAPFPARSSSVSAVSLRQGIRQYTLDLNCTTSTCGRGILDLGRVPAPIGLPVVSGEPAVGETLAAAATWTTTASRGHQWLRDGEPIPGATGPTHLVTRDDVGSRLSYRTAPLATVYRDVSATSEPTAPVPDGPDLQVAGLPTSTRYGVDATDVTVTATRDGVPHVGPVQLRRGATVLAEGVTGDDGTATLTVAGTAWRIGANAVRATALDAEGDVLASSAPTTVEVAKAVPTVVQSVPSVVSSATAPKVTATVTVPGVPEPSGTLTVRDGTKRLVTRTLTPSSDGRLVITLPRLARGTHRITTVYSGSAVVSGRTSTATTVTSR